MCGICGKLSFNGSGIDRDLLQRMCRSFSYRGPDDEGIFVAPPIGLGHRRLSIIDLSAAGHQPMCNEDETIWLVFNGEIYDFEILRKGLERNGHNLKSRTDCETIIHLYEEEGIDGLKHLNGMFAFALWDIREQRLFLARDRLGIKPLHYYWDGTRFLFASEMKAILCDREVPREIDREALRLYLTLNFIPAPWTIFKNLRKLPPGHYLLVEKGKISISEYWDVPSGTRDTEKPTRNETLDIGHHKAQLRDLLDSSVKRRLISDVPLGAFLSGGLDSSIIVALMARNSSKPIKTFSIGYKDLTSFDETAYARKVAIFNRTEHHEFKLGYRDILKAFPQVLDNVDEPFADSSAVPTYIVSRETRNHVTVALSGDGGDELFAGYRMYLGEYWSRYYAKVPTFIRNSLISPLVQALPDARDKPSLERVRRIKKFLSGMSLAFPERFCGWREIFPFSLRQRLLRDPEKENLYLGLVRETVRQIEGRFPTDTVNLMLYMDIKGLLPGDMLTKVDRMSMANALEVRIPLLDHRFVEYVFQLGGHSKLGAWGGKLILLEAFKDYLPRSLYKRPKWGFEMPIGAWFRNELRFLIDEYLSESIVKKQDFFRFEVINELVNDHMSGHRDTSWQLWNLIVFQHWFKKYL
jgi:asparagine synthase (glutamine-hydrolysing)